MAAQIPVIPCTKQLGDGNGEPVAQPDHKTQNQIIDRPGGSHRGQRMNAHKAAHNNGIRQTVKLLEQVPQHQRQSKHQDDPQRAPARQIFGHSILLLILLYSPTWYYSTSQTKIKEPAKKSYQQNKKALPKTERLFGRGRLMPFCVAKSWRSDSGVWIKSGVSAVDTLSDLIRMRIRWPRGPSS